MKNEIIVEEMINYYKNNKYYTISNHVAYLEPISNKKNISVMGINNPSPRYNNNKISTHAEINVLQKLSRKMILYHKKKMVVNLYVIKIDKEGNLKNSKPCKHCCIEMSKNKKININKIFFSNEFGKIESHYFNSWYKENLNHISYGWLCFREN